jgi:CheY-like chemotaxis protein
MLYMKIAILEDEPLHAKTLRKLLAEYYDSEAMISEFTVIDALTAKYVSGTAYYDLLFLDIVLVGTSGIETAEAIREVGSDVLIVFVTGANAYAEEIYGVVFTFIPDYQSLVTENQAWYLVGVVVFYFYLGVIVLLFSFFPQTSQGRLTAKQSALLAAMPLTATAAIILLLNYLERIGVAAPAVYLVPSVFFVLMLLFIAAFFQSADDTQTSVREQSVLRSQLEQFENQYAALEYAYTELHGIRHNWREMLLTARNMAAVGDYDNLVSYISDSERLLAADEYIVSSGNSAADIVLSVLALRSRQWGINLNINANLPKVLNVNKADLCVLISNAVDNSFEACSAISDGVKQIDIRLTVKGEYLYFAVRNTIGRE